MVKLEVRDLTFTYPNSDNPVLENISFTAEKGQMVALVGRSGSGKSTLANLIPRFYEHQHGQILLDGVDIKRLYFDEFAPAYGFGDSASVFV